MFFEILCRDNMNGLPVAWSWRCLSVIGNSKNTCFHDFSETLWTTTKQRGTVATHSTNRACRICFIAFEETALSMFLLSRINKKIRLIVNGDQPSKTEYPAEILTCMKGNFYTKQPEHACHMQKRQKKSVLDGFFQCLYVVLQILSSKIYSFISFIPWRKYHLIES